MVINNLKGIFSRTMTSDTWPVELKPIGVKTAGRRYGFASWKTWFNAQFLLKMSQIHDAFQILMAKVPVFRKSCLNLPQTHFIRRTPRSHFYHISKGFCEGDLSLINGPNRTDRGAFQILPIIIPCAPPGSQNRHISYIKRGCCPQ